MKHVWIALAITAVVCGGCATGRPARPATAAANRPVILQPEDGRDMHAFDSVLTLFLGGEQTGRTITVLKSTTPPGGGPPLHVHHDEDELFLVIEGRIEYFADGKWTEVRPGGVVYLPRNTPHRFRNVGSTPAREWTITLPSGFEKCFARCAEEFAKPGGPDMNRIIDISRECGIEYPEGIKH